MHLLSTLITLLTLTSAQVEVSLCSDPQCKEPPLAIINLTTTSVCHTDFASKALAFKTNATHPSSPPKQAARFYRSADCFAHCGSNHLIAQTQGGQTFQSLKNKPVLQSFELVDLDDEGNYPPHGYCGLRHGDAQYFRGRTWKWQQIGKRAFREVPLEDWDEVLHVKQTSTKYDWHGAVDAKGEFKWQQVMEQGWRGVQLEEWDDGVHVRNTAVVHIDRVESAENEKL